MPLDVDEMIKRLQAFRREHGNAPFQVSGHSEGALCCTGRLSAWEGWCVLLVDTGPFCRSCGRGCD